MSCGMVELKHKIYYAMYKVSTVALIQIEFSNAYHKVRIAISIYRKILVREPII